MKRRLMLLLVAFLVAAAWVASAGAQITEVPVLNCAGYVAGSEPQSFDWFCQQVQEAEAAGNDYWADQWPYIVGAMDEQFALALQETRGEVVPGEELPAGVFIWGDLREANTLAVERAFVEGPSIEGPNLYYTTDDVLVSVESTGRWMAVVEPVAPLYCIEEVLVEPSIISSRQWSCWVKQQAASAVDPWSAAVALLDQGFDTLNAQGSLMGGVVANTAVIPAGSIVWGELLGSSSASSEEVVPLLVLGGDTGYFLILSAWEVAAGSTGRWMRSIEYTEAVYLPNIQR